MPVELFSNNASTTLNGAITNVATSLVVTSAALFPVAVAGVSQFRVIIESELLIVTNTAGATWTVTRGAEGTTAAGHATGIAVVHIITAGGVAALKGTAFYGDGSDGNVTIIVSVLSLAPVGEVNLIACVEVALIVKFDMVSDALVIVAANANLNGTA